MNRDEVLEKSREQGEDEGVTFAENKGRRYGQIGFGSILVIILFYNLFKALPNDIPCTILWAYVAAEAFGRYSVTKKKSALISTLSAAIAALCFLAIHILRTSGIGL